MKLLKSFFWATRGIAHCFRRERNFRIHVLAAIYVFAFAPNFLNSGVEWAVLFLTVFLMLAAEAINTSIENLTDLASPKKNPLAKVAKDVAAGAVLLSSICAVLVGIALFWKPQIWYNLFQVWKENLIIPVLIGVSLIFSFAIIFGIKQDKNNGE